MMDLRVGSMIIIAFLAVPGAGDGQVIPGPVPGMEFVGIPAATFEYERLEELDGSIITEGQSVDLPDYQIMTTEVTREMWETVMGNDGREVLASAAEYGAGSFYPICMVNIDDCRAFVDSLNVLDSIYIYSLPLDTYWKYAASAGKYTPYPWGEDSTDALETRCWFQRNSGSTLHPVAELSANQLGLYDMLGNVYEWTTVSGGVDVRDLETGETTTGQVLRGGSCHSPARYCMIDWWIPADSSARYSDVGFRVVRSPGNYESRGTAVPYGQLLDSLLRDDRFAIFIELMLAVGGISHDFDDDDIEQFGYDVKSGCEQDAAYLRLGFGKHFGRFGAFAYGEAGHIGPGVLFDNHGPWILPEVLLRMNFLGGGIELRYWLVRTRLGYGTYGGEAEIDEDTTGAVALDSWTTDIEDGRGLNYAVGVHLPISENWSAGVEWSQHFIDLRLAESGTGAPPSEHRAKQSEIRFFANFQLPFEFGDIF